MKKFPVFGFLVAIVITALVLVQPGAPQTAGISSRADKARRLWSASAHAAKTAEAFRHWDAEGSIPTSCAKCHSTPGYRDYLGADGSTANIVDKAAPTGTTVECAACHADPEKGIVHSRTTAIFPSGVEVKGLGPEALCMECHQGRASTKSVDDSVSSAALPDEDTPSARLRFINIHYYASAATQLGTVVKGGYEYPGKTYDARFSHIPGYNACQVCHDSHSLEVDLDSCRTCHTGVNDPKDIRYYGSLVDYDGDGNVREGMYYEIESLRWTLYDTMRAYASRVIGTPIAYDPDAYPYFFIDLDDNGVVDPSEAVSANGYNRFSARLLRAAYNFQVATKDPNSYAHNGKYIIELLYDSIEDLNLRLEGRSAKEGPVRPFVQIAWSKPHPDGRAPLTFRGGWSATAENPAGSDANRNSLAAPGGFAGLQRTDEGHFDGSSAAFRNWDATGTVPSTCAKCHTAEGLPLFLEKGTLDQSLPPSNGFLCVTCHTIPPRTRFAGPVTFPSGAVKDLGGASNLCLNCHQGRAAKRTVDSAIAAGPGPYGFTNIHYYPAAASYFGSEVQGGYEFPGKTYAGRNSYPNHGGMFTNCVECHFGTKSPNRRLDESDDLFHHAAPSREDCVLCHGQDISQPHPGADPKAFEFEGIRPARTPDYDADGNTKESLKAELEGLAAALYSRLQAFSAGIGAPLAYDEHSYPYFFRDLNGNGIADPAEAVPANGYRFTAPLLRAAYNYQFARKEPCGYIHNPLYIAQLLVDSIGHLGGDTKPYAWR